MIYDYNKHLIGSGTSLKDALWQLNELSADAILFVVNEQNNLLGSLTDGDVRRGLLSGLNIDNVVDEFTQPNPQFVKRGSYTIQDILSLKENDFRVIPVLQDEVVVNVINFRYLKSYLPIDAVIMAGGRGERLKPLTDSVPKPLLLVGSKPIIRHNIDRLVSFGVDDFWISIRYLGEQITESLGDGTGLGIRINYVNETDALGTIGAVSLIDNFEHDYVLVTNSDILTDMDYERFFLDFIDSNADLSVATIPYDINVPYAILETSENIVMSLKEKPTYSYFANAGIYLMKKDICKKIPHNAYFNATDLLEFLITEGYKVTSYPLRSYWLDIGSPHDFQKAQEDINHIAL